MIAMDDPGHSRLRNIVRSAFTPRVLTRIEDSVRDSARRLVAEMVAANPDGPGELVTDFAGPLPLQIICDMMGIPDEDHQRVFHWTNVILGFGDPDLTTDFDEFVGVAMEIGAYASALAEDRRALPGDDLTTSLVQAEVEGQRLTSGEVASFFILLVVAGNETTRNAISHGLMALSRYPGQRRVWFSAYDELAPTAVEEIVRWASPVSYMRRTLLCDAESGGVKLVAGRKSFTVVRLRQPGPIQIRRSVDVRRASSPLGANLARREITVAFEELRRQIPDITASEEPSRLQSAFIHGIKRLPVTWTPPR
jgi:cytochrome P450